MVEGFEQNPFKRRCECRRCSSTNCENWRKAGHVRKKEKQLEKTPRGTITYEITLLASLPLGVLQSLLVTTDGNEAGLLLERGADGAGADLSVLQVATKVKVQIEKENKD